MKIAERSVGRGEAVFFVAEMSANHGGDITVAEQTIRAAAEAGADAVKLQTYTADTITIDCRNEYFMINDGTLWDGKSLYELYEEAYTPWEWFDTLQKVADDEGVILFSTPFDWSAVDFLRKRNVPAWKIASFEIRDIPLIRYAASQGGPIIMSTGMAELQDIERAVETCRDVGNDDIILMKCTSAYPAPIEEANVRTIPDMRERFGVEVGLSDHTLGPEAVTAAVSLGATVIEKHFILDRSLGGPDSAFSMEPEPFKEMIRTVRRIENALGEVSYEISKKVERNRRFARSLFVVEPIKKGEVFTERNVRSIRPGYGMHPAEYDRVFGMTAAADIKRGTPLTEELVDNDTAGGRDEM